jgi:formylglycine-generating enzyme required for sulfatase activity
MHGRRAAKVGPPRSPGSTCSSASKGWRAGSTAPGDLTYAFPHRTFQEYLAAVHVVARPAYADELLGRLRGDFAWWREVFFLAAATLARDPDRLAVLADAVLAEAEDAPAAEDLVQAASFVALAMAAGPFAVHADRVKRFARLRSRMQGVLSAAMLQAGGLSAAVRSAAGFALARIGDPRRELRCPEAMPFRFVPAGPFWMGSPHDDPDAYPEEVPLHRAEVPYDCWIGRFPVTVAQFAANVRAEAGEPRPLAPGAADTQPATASWHEARAFCRWLGERLRAAAPRALEQAAPGDRAHAFWTGLADGSLAAALPSEAEWEKAARGAEGHPRYPWGDAADPQRANYEDAGVGSASVVGCVPGGASPFGVEEASGNVWEWTRSLWGQDKERPSFRYPYDPADGREDWRAGDDVRRVVRGGSFHSPARSIRCSSRFGVLPAVVSPNFGFRVVVAPTAVLETRPRPAGNRRKASSRGAEKKAG